MKTLQHSNRIFLRNMELIDVTFDDTDEVILKVAGNYRDFSGAGKEEVLVGCYFDEFYKLLHKLPGEAVRRLEYAMADFMSGSDAGIRVTINCEEAFGSRLDLGSGGWVIFLRHTFEEGNNRMAAGFLEKTVAVCVECPEADVCNTSENDPFAGFFEALRGVFHHFIQHYSLQAYGYSKEEALAILGFSSPDFVCLLERFDEGLAADNDFYDEAA